MSNTELFNELTNLVDVDPYALLGISVSADDKRIAKRYRTIAKQLHPDALAGTPPGEGMAQALATQVIARIVNPSYQKLKHEKSRQETLATIRFRVRRLARTEKLVPTFQSAQQLVQASGESVDTFYEQALSNLANAQFSSLQNLHAYSLEIGQLNLVYLHRKIESPVIRSKRAGLMTNAVTPTAASRRPMSFVPAAAGANSENTGAGSEATQQEPAGVSYLEKHTKRAKTYLAKQNYDMAVQELREALKLAPQSAELHSMVGQAYYKQKLSGMAKAHFRQALKLKPDHKVAQKYSKLLGIESEPKHESTSAQSKAMTSEESSKKPWLGRLLKR